MCHDKWDLCHTPEESQDNQGTYSAVLSQTGSSLEVAVLTCMSRIRWICPQINKTQDGFLKGVMLIHSAVTNPSRGKR